MGLIQRAAQYLGVFAANPPGLQIADRAPNSGDKAYPKGWLWLDKTAGASYMHKSAGSWIALGSGTTGAVVSLTADSGGAIVPVAGNISTLGTASQITTTGTAGTITFKLPNAVIAPGSLVTTTSLASTTTLTGGTGITATTGNITATAGNVAAGAAVTAVTTITAGTGITSTTGNITASAGNLVIAGAAKQLQVKGGAATDFIGQLTLVLGAATVLNTNIAAGDKIFFSRAAANASTTLGELSYVITPATNFVVTSLILGTPGSTQTGDLSTVDYFIVRQL